MRRDWKKRAIELAALAGVLLPIWAFIVTPLQNDLEDLKAQHRRDVEQIDTQRRYDVEQINSKLDQLIEATSRIDERTRWLEKTSTR